MGRGQDGWPQEYENRIKGAGNWVQEQRERELMGKGREGKRLGIAGLLESCESTFKWPCRVIGLFKIGSNLACELDLEAWL